MGREAAAKLDALLEAVAVANGVGNAGFWRASAEREISESALFQVPCGRWRTSAESVRAGLRSRRSGVQIPPGAPGFLRIAVVAKSGFDCRHLCRPAPSTRQP